MKFIIVIQFKSITSWIYFKQCSTVKSLIVMVLILFSGASDRCLLAQTVTATITGTVTDSSGAIVVGASVTVVESGTGTQRKAITNSTGLYTITQLPPSHYDLSVMHAGFSTSNQSGIVLDVNQVAKVDMALAIGSENTTVEVTGNNPQLGTDDVSLGTVVGQKEVNDLPLNGRQFAQLLQLVPGAVPVSVGQSLTPTIGGSGDISPVWTDRAIAQTLPSSMEC